MLDLDHRRQEGFFQKFKVDKFIKATSFLSSLSHWATACQAAEDLRNRVLRFGGGGISYWEDLRNRVLRFSGGGISYWEDLRNRVLRFSGGAISYWENARNRVLRFSGGGISYWEGS